MLKYVYLKKKIVQCLRIENIVRYLFVKKLVEMSLFDKFRSLLSGRFFKALLKLYRLHCKNCSVPTTAHSAVTTVHKSLYSAENFESKIISMRRISKT